MNYPPDPLVVSNTVRPLMTYLGELPGTDSAAPLDKREGALDAVHWYVRFYLTQPVASLGHSDMRSTL